MRHNPIRVAKDADTFWARHSLSRIARFGVFMNANDSAKTIVCYGDSNTWGRVPGAGRYPRSIRWTGILQKLLGDQYEVVNEGVGGRTLVATDPEAPWRTGITHLKAILMNNYPVDLLTIMLGTNDIKNTYNLEVEVIAQHLKQTIDLARTEEFGKILVICPPEIIDADEGINERFVGCRGKLTKLSKLYQKIAQENECDFLNARDYVASSKVDGFHLDAHAHRKLAEALKDKILAMKI
jgi:lysophospholipase L1-like esterase